MPARRELHTGRYNFLHRSWSPLEPFDDSMPEILDRTGIHTHLVSDHGHYWEDGGATYHTRYSTWECVRGQEGDHWKGNLNPEIKEKKGFLRASLNHTEQCKKCRYFFICRGGCRRHRDHEAFPGCVEGENYFCQSYRMFFDSCLGKLMEIAKTISGRNFEYFPKTLV